MSHTGKLGDLSQLKLRSDVLIRCGDEWLDDEPLDRETRLELRRCFYTNDETRGFILKRYNGGRSDIVVFVKVG